MNDELANSYAIDRILPPIFNYTDTQLTINNVINGTALDPAFALGFMLNREEYDQIKLLLQLSSYTNIINPELSFNGSTLDMYFYHSDYDRLVAQANTEEFAGSLNGYVHSISDRSERCNGSNIQLLFAATTEVGGAFMVFVAP